jgi:3-hydroxyacyl-CoA dehydrogenase
MGAMTRNIETVAVLGSGTMGAGIAELHASAGCPVTLLDLTLEAAQAGLDRVADEHRSAITIGTFDDDLGRLAEADLIIEVVVENLAIKQGLFRKVDDVRRPGSIVTSNTSGIKLADLVDGMSEDFRRDVAVTHFFNPPQVMKLFELVPGPETDPEVVETLSRFAAERLDKGVVYAKDTPNFIGNRIGCYYLLHGLHAAKPFLEDESLSQETIDAVLGRPVGFPPTGLYGLFDLIGLDVLALIGQNLAEALDADDPCRAVAALPEAEARMVERGQIGRKAGGGFTKVTKLEDGSKDRETFDLVAEAWRPATAPDLDGVPAELGEVLFASSPQGEAAWAILSPVLCYAADLVPEISDDVVNIDRALRWGFNWEHGPFELLDTIGPKRFIDRLQAEDRPVPHMLTVLAETGAERFYRPLANGADGSEQEFLAHDGQWSLVQP